MFSAFPPEADIRRAGWDVRVVPKVDIRSSLDHCAEVVAQKPHQERSSLELLVGRSRLPEKIHARLISINENWLRKR